MDIEKVNIDEGKAIRQMQNKRAKELLSYSMGSDLHEVWRAGRKLEDGTYEPRIKKTKDQAYIDAHGGNNEVDIANLSFAELTSDWKFENLEAAKVAINQVYDVMMGDTPVTKEQIEAMSSVVHDEWLKRNSWVFDPEYGNPDQAKPYQELSAEEKAKDRNQIKEAMTKVIKYREGEISLEDLETKFGSMAKDDKTVEEK